MAFPYDPQILAALNAPADTIAGVLDVMRTVQGILPDHDGLKWFNGLYLSVTEAIETRVAQGGFLNPTWLAKLDVVFAGLYFDALRKHLTVGGAPQCWSVMFDRRGETNHIRAQFAFAGMNAHIDHDLPLAIVETCRQTGTKPVSAPELHRDYTGVNATLDALTDKAKQELHVGMIGQAIPPLGEVEDLIAHFGLTFTRERAWKTARDLWLVRNLPVARAAILQGLEISTAALGEVLMAPLP